MPIYLLFLIFAVGIPSAAWAHDHGDYAAAEAARQRNEPAFVAPQSQPLDSRQLSDDSSTTSAPQTLAASGPLDQIGQWGPIVNWGFAFQGAANLPDGRIIAWGGNNRFSFSGGNSAFAAIWDPTTGQFTNKNHNDHPLFCSIPTMLEDGRVFVNGGDSNTNKVSTFDYRTNQWKRVENMTTGRWYPGSVALPNGKVFTMLGRPGGIYPEVWTEGQGWSLRTGANLNNGVLNFSGYQSTWLPYLHLKPDGEIFHSGPTQQMNTIDPNGNGQIISTGLTNSWYPKYSSSVMYDEGKVLVAGGAAHGSGQAPGTNQAMILDFTGPTPTKTNIAPMEFSRKFNNAVVLPTGEVLVIGGNTSGIEFSDSGTILAPEVWNPDTQTWREMADMAVPRNYHSVALLMTDGRVWSGGGGLCNCSADHPDHQVFSPPYLFNADGSLATRPVISSAPNTVGTGSVIDVDATPGIQRFSLIKMSGITHNLNSDLRALSVSFTPTGTGTYELTLHPSANVLTPGFWMLFAVNDQGVPSVAKVIQVLKTPPPSGSHQFVRFVADSEINGNPWTSMAELNVLDSQGNPLSQTGWSVVSFDSQETAAENGRAVNAIDDNPTTFWHTEYSSNSGSANDPAHPHELVVDLGTGYDLGGFTYLPRPGGGNGTVSAYRFYISGDGVNWGSAVAQGTFANSATEKTVLFSPPPSNHIPNVTNPGNQTHIAGTTVNLPILATDPDSDPLVYSTTGLPNGLNIDTQSGIITGTLTNLGTFTVTITVDDGQATSTTNFTWVVVALNGTPEVTYEYFEGTWSVLPNFDSITPLTSGTVPNISLSPRLRNDDFGMRFTGYLHISTPGTYTFYTSSDDGSQLWVNDNLIVNNDGLHATQEASGIATLETGAHTVRVTFFERGGHEELTVSYAGPGITKRTIPDQAWLSTTGPANQPPEITTPNNQTNIEGDPVSLLINASDPDGDNLTYGTTGLPPGLSINTSTGVINGALAPNSAGSYSVTATVSDGHASSSVSFTWTVTAPVNQNPVLNNPGNQTNIAGDVVNLPIIASDGDGDILAYSATGLPTGVSINTTTGNLTGTLVASGSFTSTVNVSDGKGGIANATFTWLVNPAPTIILTPITTTPQATNQPVQFSVTATGGNGVLRYKWLFGDNTPETAFSTSAATSHTFQDPGRYIVTVTVTDSAAQQVSQQFHQAIHRPLSTTRPISSMSLSYEQRNGNDRIWNVNPDNDTVSIFDTITHTKIAEIEVGEEPRSVAIAPDGRVWVANRNSATVSIIDPNSLGVVQTLPLPSGSQPFGLGFNSSGTHGYLTLQATGQLIRMNPVDGSQTGSVDIGSNPRHIALNADGSKVYVSRFITPKLPGEETANPQVNGVGGEVVVVDATTMNTINTIILAVNDGSDFEAGARGVPNYLGAPVLSPDGTMAWVPSKQDNILRGSLRDGNNLNFEHTVRAISSHIALSTDTEVFLKRLDHDNAGLGSAGAFGRYGNYYFVALETSREIAIVDAYQGSELFRIEVGRAPQGLVISPDGLKLYVHNFMDRSVEAYDLTALVNTGSLTIDRTATYSTVATESLTTQVLQGKQLFYDARDNRLARDAYISCASCHNNGDHDGRVWDLTGFGEGLRNTISLKGHGGPEHGRLHWSGNFDEVQDFEGQIRTLAGGTGLMDDADFNSTSNPLGAPKAGLSAALDALAAYVNSLTNFTLSPHRSNTGALTSEGIAGRTVFETHNCTNCHSGSGFTDSPSNLLHDIGTMKSSSGNRLGQALIGLDTPTLRGVWHTAPYLHDGSAATLTQAVVAHTNLTIPAEQLNPLVAFLSQIDGQEPAPVPINQPPQVANPGPQTNQEGNTVSLAIVASDPENAVLTYHAAGLPSGLSLNSSTGTITGTLESNSAGTHSVTVTVSDGLTDVLVQFTWTVTESSEPPTYTPLATYRTDFQANTPAPNWAYLWNATGPIGTATQYSPLTGDGLFYSNGTSLHLDATGGQPGPGVNQFLDETTDRYVIAAYTVPEANTYALTQSFLEANDTDCGPDNILRVQVYVNNTLKKTASVSTGIRGSFDIELGQLTAGDQILVAVGPEEENWCDRFEWDFTIATLNPPTANIPPILTNPGDQTHPEGTAVRLVLQATDANGDTLIFDAEALPPGLSLTPTTGVIEGILNNSRVGQYAVTLTVRDGQGGADSVAFLWTITDPTSVNQPPVVTNPGPQTHTEGQVINLAIVATDAEGDPLTYSASNLPPGLTINNATGVIAGTLTNSSAGTYTVLVTVQDSNADVPIQFSWVVQPPPTDQTATYRVTFTSTWSQATHPHPNGAASFPPTPHLSGLIGGSHNENVTFWQNGATASLGIKNMAEQGLKTDLQNEVNQAISAGIANTVISGGGIPLSPDSVSISSVVMTKEYPLVTLTSMIAPSPDWFVGVSGLSLLDDQNNWLPEKVVVLYPYDAGTDSGTDYLALDNATTPPAPITRLQDVAPFSNQPIGTFTFTRTDQNQFVPIANYRTDFQADTPAPNWAYLWNASGPIGTATHYSALTGEGLFYSNGTSLHLDATGGQPGPGVNQFLDETTDRYVIAAYTVPTTNAYALTQSFLEANDTDCGPDNVLRVQVYVNNTLKKTVSVTTGIRGTFDIELGQLTAGEQIVVAVGPEEENWCDRFEWDFTIATTGQPPTYTPVTSYRTDFQADTPAPNWAYLWNATGPIGTATHYSALTGEGLFYSNGTSLHLDATGGQPGPGVNQFLDETTDRYVIAAYTVSTTNAYALTQSFLEANDTDCGPDNRLRVQVYVNNTLKKTVSVATGIRGAFDIELGQLTAGEQIVVAVGPEEENWCDRFEWDFTIAAAP